MNLAKVSSSCKMVNAELLVRSAIAICATCATRWRDYQLCSKPLLRVSGSIVDPLAPIVGALSAKMEINHCPMKLICRKV